MAEVTLKTISFEKMFSGIEPTGHRFALHQALHVNIL